MTILYSTTTTSARISQWADAVPTFERLEALADSKGLEFGWTFHTFPVDTTRGELPNNEMYMSGRSPVPPDH